jgi:phosphatidylserine decarboxylase
MKLSSESFRFLIPGILLFILIGLMTIAIDHVLLSYLLIAVTLYISIILFFFRDPDRSVPDNPRALVSPADGRVIAVDENIPDYFRGFKKRVSIFLSMLDVHINRVPVDGKINRVDHRSGRFRAAFTEKAAEENEHTIIEIENSYGKIGFCQRAGMIARRIVCNLKDGQTVQRGERFGMIRFGSRVDLYLPENVSISVSKGARVTGGETVIGEFSANES